MSHEMSRGQKVLGLIERATSESGPLLNVVFPKLHRYLRRLSVFFRASWIN